MRRATLTRTETTDEGTFGELVVEDKSKTVRLVSLELPWRGNASGRSCIPAGKYVFKMVDSPSHGRCYEEHDLPGTPQREDVPGRTHIQIHAANLAGDVERGYVSQLLGCIAPGASIAHFRAGNKPAGDKDQRGVTFSKMALNMLEAALCHETFELTVSWAPGVGPNKNS